MKSVSPGGYQPLRDRWGSFTELVGALSDRSLVLVDRRVASLHPIVSRGLRKAKSKNVLSLIASERLKSLATLQTILAASVSVPRSGTLLAIGGGTVGDVATVAAHLIKRGIRLIQVPTTLLAAVDSSVGGKGAVHVRAPGDRWVKNGAGVFHYPSESWLCPEFFDTLTPRQLREGAVEAWKMAVSLDASFWRRLTSKSLTTVQMIRNARALKDDICFRDPYERVGIRQILNFGHTFGHVLESVTDFQLSHGDSVGLGILCALDVGRLLGHTPLALAQSVESALLDVLGILGRDRLQKALARESADSVKALLLADKKVNASGQITMIVLRRIALTKTVSVPDRVWRHCLKYWRRGERP